MPKKPSRKTLKAKAWKAFSEYMRRSYADHREMCECYTCGKVDHWKKMQAGHFVGSRCNAVLFNEEVVRVQCPACNIFLHGNYHEYTLKMIDEVGRDQVEEYLALKHKVVKITLSELKEIYEEYKYRLSLM